MRKRLHRRAFDHNLSMELVRVYDFMPPWMVLGLLVYHMVDMSMFRIVRMTVVRGEFLACKLLEMTFIVDFLFI